MRTKRLTLQQRKEIFAGLVAAQDSGTMNVPESRQHVMKQFKISDVQLRQIEDEGVDKDWPPLNNQAVPAPAMAAVTADAEADADEEAEVEAEAVEE